MTAPVPLPQAFAMFENPHNLAKITPPWLNFRVVTPEPVVMRKGAEIDYVIRWLGLPIRWKTLITAYDPPHGFVDEQARGPYTLWRHQHTLTETERGHHGFRLRYLPAATGGAGETSPKSSSLKDNCWRSSASASAP